MGIWRSLGLSRSGPYLLERLVDGRVRMPVLADHGQAHIICDIDKTYLETSFESVVRMARIAFEDAEDKVTVVGASEVLLALRWGLMEQPLGQGHGDYPRPLHFVSSSPPQLRTVLEKKLSLDGLDWNSDTFKNQAYNLRMGRMDLLRHHFAYKSRAILNIVQGAGPQARFFMIGDNAESDTYIYVGIKLFLAGYLSASGYQKYLEIAGVEKAVARDILKGLPEASQLGRVEGIIIRRVPGYDEVDVPPLTRLAIPFDDFFQAALYFVAFGVMDPHCLGSLLRLFHNRYGLALSYLHECLAILVAREPQLSTAMGTAKSASRTDVGTEDGQALAPVTAKLKTLRQGLARRQEPALTINEEQIFAHAGTWIERIHAAKA